jgi:hypothetical protein
LNTSPALAPGDRQEIPAVRLWRDCDDSAVDGGIERPEAVQQPRIFRVFGVDEQDLHLLSLVTERRIDAKDENLTHGLHAFGMPVVRPPARPVEVDVFDANIEKAMRVIVNTLGVRGAYH